MAVVQAGENIELWRDLTQNVTLSVGTILNRTGSVYYRGKGKVHIRKFVCVSFYYFLLILLGQVYRNKLL